MTISQQQQEVLEDNWDEAADRIRGLFPNLSQEVDLSEYRDDLVTQVAQDTGTGVSEVEIKFGSVAQELDVSGIEDEDPDEDGPDPQDQGLSVPEPTTQPEATVREANGPKR